MADETSTAHKDSPGYSYSPLPDASSIRLLRRMNRDGTGPLRFSLRVYGLDNPDLRYHCLSYTWRNPFAHGRGFGNLYEAMDPVYAPHNAVTIFVDDRPMRVSRNLHEALATLPESAYEEYTNRPTRNQGRTLMHGAASNGRYNYLYSQAMRGGDPNVTDENGETPLHHAAANGFEKCVELLCEIGALRTAKDKNGQSPKDLAAFAGHESVVSLLQDWESRPDPETPSIPRDRDGAEKWIWIDAICINQNDIDEKGAQVSMMDLIYTRATFVIAWLGPADGYTEAGIKALDTLSNHVDKFRESRIEPFSGTDRKSYQDAGMPLVSPREWDGLANIYQRQWFRRSWVVQEAVLPNTLIAYCGEHMLSIHELGVVAQTIRIVEARCGTRLSGNYTSPGAIAVPVEWNMAEVFKWRENMYWTERGETEEKRRGYREGFTLERLVGDFRTFLSSDPRDKIFALSGILSAFTGERPQADYRKSVASVYAGATRQIIRETGSLEVLGQRANEWGAESLPSWVPNFAVPGVMAVRKFTADGGFAFPGVRDEEPGNLVLGIQGLRVGSITEVGGRVSTAPGGTMMFDPSWLRLVLSLRDKHESGTEKPILTEILWRTLCMNTTASDFFHPEMSRTDAPEEMGRQFLIFMAMMLLAGGDQKMLESVGLEAHQEREMHTIIHLPKCKPWEGELEAVLGYLDALLEYDREHCFTPTKQEVLVFWNDVKYTIMRTADVRYDGGPLDFRVPPRVMNGVDRLVGRGVVNMGSPVYQKCRDFGSAFQTAYGGRQVVTVDERLLGLAPVGAMAGDEIWVVPGLGAPAVLRRVGGGGGDAAGEMEGVSLESVPRFEFVGVSYVHGIMDGEAAQGRESELQDVSLV